MTNVPLNADVQRSWPACTMRTADDLFGGPEGSPRTDKLIAASVQWAQEIMKKVDSV